MSTRETTKREQPRKNFNNGETHISKIKRSFSQALSSEKREKQKLPKKDYILRYLQSPSNSPNRLQFSANEEFDMEIASNIMEVNSPPPSPSKKRGAILREKKLVKQNLNQNKFLNKRFKYI